MKLKIFIAVVLVAVAWVAGRTYINGRAGAGSAAARNAAARNAVAGERGAAGDAGTVAAEGGATVQRINESYKLAPGARVEVHGINGPVEVASAEGDTAEVQIESRADDAKVLERGKIRVEHASDRLVVRGPENGGGGFFAWLTGKGGRAKHNVRLLVPRKVTLSAAGVNGRLHVGEIEGGMNVTGVNGVVEITSAAGGAEVSGVNGGVSFALASVGGEGVQVSGVNGRVEVRLAPTVNADVDVSGVNGRVNNELANAVVGEQTRAHFSARVGAGGPRISLHGINGGVTLAAMQEQKAESGKR